MRDRLMTIVFQEWAADEYADARDRRDGKCASSIPDYIADNFRYGADYSRRARALMGVTEQDQLYA